MISGVRVPPAMAAYAGQGGNTTTSCSSTNVYEASCRLCRRLYSSAPTTRAGLQAPSLRSHPVYAVPGPSLESGRYDGSLRPWRRRLSFWGGSSISDQPQRPGAGGDGNALQGGPEELARLEQEVLNTLAGVCEPSTGKGVISLGLVQDLLVRGEELLWCMFSHTAADCCLFACIIPGTWNIRTFTYLQAATFGRKQPTYWCILMIHKSISYQFPQSRLDRHVIRHEIHSGIGVLTLEASLFDCRVCYSSTSTDVLLHIPGMLRVG